MPRRPNETVLSLVHSETVRDIVRFTDVLTYLIGLHVQFL